MKLRGCAVATAVAVAALAAGSAGAKEGVEATLLTTVPKDAAPGSTIRIEWRLAELGGRPFGAGGVFVRLVGSGGGATTTFAHEGPTGRFAADARVPDRGIEALRIGLRGMSCARSCTTADSFFRVVNDPFADTWTPLRRPLRVPTLGHGRTCPVSRRATGIDFASFGVARGYGPGPAYPIGYAGSTIAAVRKAGPWGYQKVLWFVHPSYRGPVLVRGVQLDGPNRVRFDRGALPPAELRLPQGTRDRPSFVRIRTPGCYAFQIDGLTFSRTIVFRAVGR
jgi:hypothetical protein